MTFVTQIGEFCLHRWWCHVTPLVYPFVATIWRPGLTMPTINSIIESLHVKDVIAMDKRLSVFCWKFNNYLGICLVCEMVNYNSSFIEQLVRLLTTLWCIEKMCFQFSWNYMKLNQIKERYECSNWVIMYSVFVIQGTQPGHYVWLSTFNKP